ncbi:MAG: preprotein translocase subunit SecE [Bacilli bacterium]|nr:preprotein translocase subunit SecE [Bacilli bacterium]
MKKLIKFFVSVKKEMAKVKWPTKKELFSYSIATVSFIVLFALFFMLTDTVLSLLKVLFI